MRRRKPAIRYAYLDSLISSWTTIWRRGGFLRGCHRYEWVNKSYAHVANVRSMYRRNLERVGFHYPNGHVLVIYSSWLDKMGSGWRSLLR